MDMGEDECEVGGESSSIVVSCCSLSRGVAWISL